MEDQEVPSQPKAEPANPLTSQIPEQRRSQTDPQILGAFNVTPTDEINYHPEAVGKEEKLKKAFEEGKEYYRAISTNPELDEPFYLGRTKDMHWAAVNAINLGEFKGIPIADRPDRFLNTITKDSPRTKDDPERMEEFYTRLRGIGEAALEAKDWETAVNALDVASPDGLLNNQDDIDKINQAFEDEDNAGTRVEIARLIQRRINEGRSKPKKLPYSTNPEPSNPSFTSVLTKTPEGLRPAPPPPEQPQ